MKPQAHTMHVMKLEHSTVVDVPVRSYSMAKYQKRIMSLYLCDCRIEEIIYRELNNSDFTVTEYKKEVVL